VPKEASIQVYSESHEEIVSQPQEISVSTTENISPQGHSFRKDILALSKKAGKGMNEDVLNLFYASHINASDSSDN
jgi:hypothetical protein